MFQLYVANYRNKVALETLRDKIIQRKNGPLLINIQWLLYFIEERGIFIRIDNSLDMPGKYHISLIENGKHISIPKELENTSKNYDSYPEALQAGIDAVRAHLKIKKI
jgi:hypothetical protein